MAAETAIRIYGGDFFGTPRSEWDAETLVERPLDLENARRTFKEANERFETGRHRLPQHEAYPQQP